jgi:hypothetical protein
LRSDSLLATLRLCGAPLFKVGQALVVILFECVNDHNSALQEQRMAASGQARPRKYVCAGPMCWRGCTCRSRCSGRPAFFAAAPALARRVQSRRCGWSANAATRLVRRLPRRASQLLAGLARGGHAKHTPEHGVCAAAVCATAPIAWSSMGSPIGHRNYCQRRVKPSLKKRQNPPLFNPFGVSFQRPVGGSMTLNIGGAMTAVSCTFTRCEPQPL